MIYLYVKRHTKTGLKYFGKTTRSNPYSYKGSGTYWKHHLKKHGAQFVATDHLWTFEDQEKCTRFALDFSKENNIVESAEWANLRPEDALNGPIARLTTEELKENQRLVMKRLYEDNKEARKKKQLEYYYRNREKRLAYHQANRDHNIERQRKWRIRKLAEITSLQSQ